jgi:hypothetical protein
LPDRIGGRRDVLLGKYGTAASRAEYGRVVTEWEANGRNLIRPAAVADLTVHEFLVLFWNHAEVHYRRRGGTSSRGRQA